MRLDRKTICRLGYRSLSVRTNVPSPETSVYASAFVAGSGVVGPGVACLSQTACTWASVTPNAARRVSRTVVYVASVVLSQSTMTLPPCAPSTMTRCERSTLGSASAWPTNELDWQEVGPPPQNSCVVLDIPTDSRTIFPLASACPAALRGRMLRAKVVPRAACDAGTLLDPPGYRPPWKPRYVEVPSWVSGTRAVSGCCPAGPAGDSRDAHAPRTMKAPSVTAWRMALPGD